ncbi:hypothetical protein NAC44_10045 [Allorhizobium sp. BGMRC 0089]|uniref:hypothetical protein n=1 Tax=Allorhizobium sonneratiae TaxID=2934936 RepID=UPI0020334208|nr:hypothetical protein [Allorhizobium sonneratiae]MCM2292661.1 hypothetical protein [Allorhizobium sonneratiae]
MRIIFHAGTPKTGTTALQNFLHNHREHLLEHGVLYPRAGIAQPPAYKHQWIVGNLMKDTADDFSTMMDAVFAEARPDTHTILLSTEGLFHRWWDYSPAGLQALATLAARFPVELWAFFREPVAFTRSFYIQMLKNPHGLGPCYGLDVSLQELLDEPRFAIHLDYIGYIRAVEAVLGAGKVRPFPYHGHTVADILQALAIADLDPEKSQENRTVGEFGVALLRQINRQQLDVEQKWRAVKLINDLDTLIDGYKTPLQLDQTVLDRIHELAADSMECLRREYGILL